MRNLATKIFSAEVGCDWLTPSWGETDGSGETVYCHSAATYEQRERGFKNATLDEVETMAHRCSVMNWMEYFRMSSVEVPANSTLRTVEVRSIRWHTSGIHALSVILRNAHKVLMRTCVTRDGRGLRLHGGVCTS